MSEPLTDRARQLLEWHERELTMVLEGLGPGDVGYEMLVERREGCRTALGVYGSNAPKPVSTTAPTAGPADVVHPERAVRGVPRV